MVKYIELSSMHYLLYNQFIIEANLKRVCFCHVVRFTLLQCHFSSSLICVYVCICKRCVSPVMERTTGVRLIAQ